MPKRKEIIDWDEMSEEDRNKAVTLLKELNNIFDSYAKPDKDKSEDEKIPPRQD
jgi:hypothetical protein